MKFEIKQVCSTDSQAMEEIARVCSESNQADGIGGEVDMLDEMMSTWKGDYILAAYLDGKAIGVVSDSQIGQCLTLWVAAENRGHGVEGAMLKAMEALYRMNGVQEASAPAEMQPWLSELLQENGFRYRGGDVLTKSFKESSLLSV